MIGFALAAAMFAILFSFIWLFVIATERKSLLAWIGAFLVLFLSFGTLLQLSISSEEKGPCITYETKMAYDPALKIAREARVCIERGEWVE